MSHKNNIQTYALQTYQEYILLNDVLKSNLNLNNMVKDTKLKNCNISKGIFNEKEL